MKAEVQVARMRMPNAEDQAKGVLREAIIELRIPVTKENEQEFVDNFGDDGNELFCLYPSMKSGYQVFCDDPYDWETPLVNISADMENYQAIQDRMAIEGEKARKELGFPPIDEEEEITVV